jgi:hypothetical protein
MRHLLQLVECPEGGGGEEVRVLWGTALRGIGHIQLYIKHQVPHRTVQYRPRFRRRATVPMSIGCLINLRKSGIQIASGSTGW